MTRFNFFKKASLLLLKVLGVFSFFGIQKIFGIEINSAHSRLKNKVLLEKFKQICNKLTCVCGRTMPLNYINDFGHCNAWPMRSVVDGLLEKNWSEKKILNGFVHGFGGIVHTDLAFELPRSKEYRYLIDRFENGFGKTIIASSGGTTSIVGITTLATMLVSGLFLFLKKRKEGLPKLKMSSENSPTDFNLTQEEKKYIEKLD